MSPANALGSPFRRRIVGTLFQTWTWLACLALAGPALQAQVASNNAFLHGNYVEIGIAPGGYFGSSVGVPTGYYTITRSNLGFITNYDKSGTFPQGGSCNWSSHPHSGDYFLPGSPEQGFTLEFNGVAYSNNGMGSAQIATTQFPTYTYDSASQVSTSVWIGQVSGLQVTRTVSVGVNDLKFSVNLTIKNTNAATANNLYYMDNTDPDNAVDLGGSSEYTTVNKINEQDASGHWVQAYSVDYPSIPLIIGTVDTRARVYYGGFSNRSASSMYNTGNGLATNNQQTGDEAIGLAYRFDSLAPGQSVSSTYYFMLNASLAVGAVNVTAPPVSSASAGGPATLNFTVSNPTGNDITLTGLSATSSDASWTFNPIANPTPTVPANGSITVPLTVNIPSGKADTSQIKLTATCSGGTAADFTNVTATVPVGVTITASVTGPGSVTPTGTSHVAIGDSQTYTFTANPGYGLMDVTVDGNSVGPVSTYTFTSVNANHVISASFNTAHTLTSTVVGSGGIMSPSTDVVVGETSCRTIGITPSRGYHLTTVALDGGAAQTVTGTDILLGAGAATFRYATSDVNFVNISTDHILTATFAKNSFTLTPSLDASTVATLALNNGSAAPFSSAAQALYQDKAAVTVGVPGNPTAFPTRGYQLSSLQVDGQSVAAYPNLVYQASPYQWTLTLGAVQSNHAISATAMPTTTWAITPSIQNGGLVTLANGVTTATLTDGTAVNVDAGDSLTATIAPDGTHVVTGAFLDGNAQAVPTTGGNVYIPNLTAAHTLSVTFAPSTFVLSGNAGTPGALITPSAAGTSGAQTTASDGSYTLTVPYGWAGNLTATKAGCTFTPPLTYAFVDGNAAAQNFTPSLTTLTISGTAPAGTLVSYAGSYLGLDGLSQISENGIASGLYTLQVHYGWAGTVTPSLSGYTLTPASQTYPALTSPQTLNFTGAPTIPTIAGTILDNGTPLQGVTLTFASTNGGASGTATTATDGTYAFTVTSGEGWAGTVTPSLAGYQFTPATATIPTMGNNVAQSFTALAQTDITSFSFTRADNPSLAQTCTGAIHGHTIVIALPVGTSLNNLVATFTTNGPGATPNTVTVGGTPQISASTANDFSSTALTYSVTGADTPTNSSTYVVNVNAGSLNVVGTYLDASSKPQPYFEKDGSFITLSLTGISNWTAASKLAVTAITADTAGDESYYVLGAHNATGGGNTWTGAYWKVSSDGSTVTRYDLSPATLDQAPNSITVINGVVTITGQHDVAHDMATTWTGPAGGTLSLTTLPDPASGNDASNNIQGGAVFAGNTYVSGFCLTTTSKDLPIYWKNDTGYNTAPLPATGNAGVISTLYPGSSTLYGGGAWETATLFANGSPSPCYWATTDGTTWSVTDLSSTTGTSPYLYGAVLGASGDPAATYFVGWCGNTAPTGSTYLGMPCLWSVSAGSAQPAPLLLNVPAGTHDGKALFAATNAAGAVYIAGYFTDAGGVQHPCYWTLNGLNVDLSSMLPAGAGSAQATAICAFRQVTISNLSPAGQTGAPGTVTFTASVTGGYTDNVTWSATAGSFAGNVWTSPTTPGTYTITATSADDPGKADSTTYTISAPVITTQPVSQNACSNDTVTFSVTAPYAAGYQWKLNGSSLSDTGVYSGSTTRTLVLTGATSANGGTYTCLVSNPAGSVTSNPGTLQVGSSITSQPQSASAFVTQTTTFSVAASGQGALRYQWYMNGSLIGGAIGSTYTTPALDSSFNGASFYVTVQDNCTILTSGTATLGVTAANVPPTITAQPSGQTATIGGTATFTVAASGPGPLNYQWYRLPYSNHAAGTTYPVGSNAASYMVPGSATQTANDGDWYFVAVTNPYGQAVSLDAPLAVGDGILMQITGQPQSTYVGYGSSATFSVDATSGASISYQWYRADPGSTTFNPITGATGSTYTLTGASSNDSGAVYDCVLTNGLTHDLTSSTAALFVGSLGSVGSLAPGSGWTLNGSATQASETSIQLTADVGGQSASIFWPDRVSTAKFQVAFTIAVSAKATPADGFALVLADPSLGATAVSTGQSGSGLGANGIPGFVLGFDTYDNGRTVDPAPPPYLGVGRGENALWEKPWTYVNSNIGSISSFANSSHDYVVTVVNGTMTVTMDGSQIFSGPVSLPPVAYLGFTASTGGSSEQVVISNLTATVSAP